MVRSTLLATWILFGVVLPAHTADETAPYQVGCPPADKYDPFYEKQLSANGFAILASERVSDYALLEAAYLIDQMLARRDDIRQTLIASRVRFAIMAPTELTTQIPEHSDLKPSSYWDRGARGLGATPVRPAVSCGEENLLNYPGDPYSKENILIHEFAHAIHRMALNRIDKQFHSKLRACYVAATQEGLWQGTYAAANIDEYWAEGVQSWFGTNRENDHDHNHVNTREELQEYDPRLAQLIEGVFGSHEWAYRRPADRVGTLHLVGYDPSQAPTFAWPETLQSNPFLSRQPGYPKWSAFTGLKWKDDRPIVQVDGEWYELLKFHEISIDEIRNTCEKNHWPFRHRFTEDLVQIVRLMGHEIDKTTDLELRDASGEIVTLKNVAMTEANLRRTMRSAIRNATLSREDALLDLRAFQEALESQFSYRKANDVDYRAAIGAIAGRLEGETGRAWLARELQLVMAQFIDGHAGVSGATSLFAEGFLPFLIVPSGDRYVAIRPNRIGFLDDEFPYLKSMDGVELSEWLKATEKYVPKGSPQYCRRHGLRYLRGIQQFRSELGLAQTATLDVELASRDGRTVKSSSEMVADSGPRYGEWPPVKEPGVLEGNIGYLRLESMNDDAVRLLRTWMPRFRNTDGLIIDVRVNGGGIRTPILELAGYLLSKDDPPRIGNVAKYRLAEQFSENHLSAARFVYRENSPRFGERERAAIHEFKKTFHPEWTPPERQFSEWHYLVLSKKASDPRFDYRRPVAILLDENCFSATDIFLGTFKGWPGVTLIGQPSGGGSARFQAIRLPRSGISVRCASMASFQPDGQLYDTHGVQPDIRVVRSPEYYLRSGEDVILKTALGALRKNQRED